VPLSPPVYKEPPIPGFADSQEDIHDARHTHKERGRKKQDLYR